MAAGTTVTGASYLQDVDLVRVLTGLSNAPELDALDVRGAEDEVVPLAIRVYAAEETELEEVSVIGLPEGFALSHGARSTDGSWQLPFDQLDRVSLISPEHYHGTLSLSVEATARNGTERERTIEHFRVRIAAVADVPDLRVAPADGLEDQPVRLKITAAPTDDQETVAVVVRGLPAGATLSHGTAQGDTWGLEQEELDGTTLQLPENFKGSFTIQVEAIAHDDDDTVLVSRPLAVDVRPVADQPALSVTASAGTEDQPIPVEILAETSDSSETLTVEVAGLPPEARLSAGVEEGEGRWLVGPDEARGLSLLPPPNFSGELQLDVTVGVQDGSDQSSITKPVRIAIAPAADTPTLTAASVSGREDQPIPLSLAATSRDSSEDIQVRIGGLPQGARLSAGSATDDGRWLLPADELADVSLQPPLHFSGEMQLGIEATSIDGKDIATTSRDLVVSVAPVADQVSLGGLKTTGTEDEPIPVGLTLSGGDPSESISLLVMDTPAGASFSNGQQDENGTWSLAPSDLEGLIFNPPPEVNGTIRMPVVVTSIDGADRATSTGELSIDVAPVADPVQLRVANASGIEDRSVPLQIQIDAPDNQAAWLTITGLPAGAGLSAGESSADGWRLEPADLVGLELQPAADFSGAFTLEAVAISADGGDQAEQRQPIEVAIEPVADDPILTIAASGGAEDASIPLDVKVDLTDPSESASLEIAGIPEGSKLVGGTDRGDGTWVVSAARLAELELQPPPNFSGQLDLELTAVANDGASAASVTQPLRLDIAPVADAPELVTAAATGTEDEPVPLDILLKPADTSEEVAVFVSGLPDGSQLSAGQIGPAGEWRLIPEDLNGLFLTPAANASGLLELAIAAVSTDGDSTATTDATLLVTLAPMAEVPTIEVVDVAATEDERTRLPLTAVSSDPDEAVSLLLSGLPEGSRLNHGTERDPGSWALHAPADLIDLELTLAPDTSGTFPLEVVAVSTDGETQAESTASLTLSVAPVADPAVLSVSAVSGPEDQLLPVPLRVEKPAREALTLQVSGLPTAASLSTGQRNEDGSWSLPPDAIDGLTLAPPANFSGDFRLTVVATTVDGTDEAVVTETVPVNVLPVADLPILTANPVAGDEDTPIPLEVAAVADDPSERLDVQVWGLPADSFLSAGRALGGGHWLLAPDKLDDLRLIPPPNYSGDVRLRISATTVDGTDEASTVEYVEVAVRPVADVPIVTAAPSSGEEDTPIPLEISAINADPSEELTISVAQLPEGATLTQGASVSDGVVSLTQTDLADLSLLPPPHFSGTLELAVTATSNDQGRSSSTVTPIAVTIAPVADQPSLTVRDAIGIEDGIIALDIQAETADPSEQLVLRLAGLPAGSEIASGTSIGDGVWEMSGDLRSLSLIPPANFSGQIDVQVTATSVDDDTTAATDATMQIGVVPVADPPNLVATDVTGAAGRPLPLAITAVSVDPRETIALSLIGLPGDFALSAGERTDGGEWLLEPSDLEGLAVLPPIDRRGTLDAIVRGVATDGSDRALVETTFSITVVPPSEQPVAQSVGLVPPANAAEQSNSSPEAASTEVARLPAPTEPPAEALPPADAVEAAPEPPPATPQPPIGRGRRSTDPKTLGSRRPIG